MRNTQLTSLVIGNKGQIGSALQKILECDGIDVGETADGSYGVIHIAIPYSESFDLTVRQYQEIYAPQITVVHSTVPIGTSKKLGAVHSPCRGIHPDLEKGIRTFVKFFGGQRADQAAELFSDKGVPTSTVSNSDTTEAMKLWDTTVYGFNILLEKLMYEYCKENNVDYEIVNSASAITYNKGYEELGKPNFSKYVLQHVEGPIGGHCVRSNVSLLGGTAQEAFDFIEKKLGL